MITHLEITELLGPSGISWDFEELKRVNTRNGRTRALVKVWVRKHVFSGSYDVDDAKQFEKVTIQVWGTASAKAERDAPVIKAIENAMMWFGLLPELAKAHGLDEALAHLGPAGLEWEVSELMTQKVLTATGPMVRCEVEMMVSESAFSLDGKGNKTITRKGIGEVRAFGSSCVEDDALIAAVKDCFKWMALRVTTDSDVEKDYDYDEITAQRERWAKASSPGVFRKLGGMMAASLLFLIGK